MTRDEYIKRWQENARGGNGCGPSNSFVNHIATRTDYAPDVYAIDWRNRDGSNAYAVRYLFDGSALIVRGDLGEFLFDRHGSEAAAKWLGNMRNLHYVKEKTRCATDMYDCVGEIFETDLAEWIAGQNGVREETEATIRKLWRDCGENLETALFLDEDLTDGYDFEELAYVGGFGRVMSAKFVLVVEGLNMALEQLNRKD